MWYQPSENRTFSLHAEIRATFPNTSFPVNLTDEMLAEFGVYPVIQVAPTFDQITHTAQETTPELVNGQYEQRWNIVALPAEQVAANLDAKKAQMVSAVNARRNAAEEAGFFYLGKPLDSDSRSVQRINTAVQAAQVALAASAPFELEWMCADNTTITLDAQQMLGVPVALATHANAIHLNGRNLKDAIASATTSAEFAAIDIESGWHV